MPELVPLPFAQLVRRMFREFKNESKIFDLPASKFWRGSADGLNTGVRFHGLPAATPLGPAAGPHTQMAQNIVLSWLGGCRIMELKTVQIDDRLTIGRPCIDATNVGYNIEFSQELLLGQSLDEYVKAWMLIRMLEHEETLGVPKRVAPTGPDELPNFYDCIFDLSCGYNLEGIRSDKVQNFIRGLLDATHVIDRLRAEIPDEFAHLRNIEYLPNIVSTATLSTFHGCPADEIERIVEFLLKENRLNTIVKMNPTMLGGERLDEILHATMGYNEIEVNPAALTSGLQFEDSIAITRRLRKLAHSLGLRVGAKFNNTLEVINHRNFFPANEKVMYMSGAPLHPIAVELAHKFRAAYLSYVNGLTTDEREREEDGYVPISFSAGVDKLNFPLCAASGFVPITTCTDLLKPGGYGRLVDYMKSLEGEMGKLGASTIDEFVIKYNMSGETDVATQASDLLPHFALANHQRIAEETVADTRYWRARNAVIPKRINSYLTVFDCITCDKCIPVCPNDANFTYGTPETDITYRNYLLAGGHVLAIDGEHRLQLKKGRQIANFAAFCNECGNCDTFCPEYGGPFIQKPTFFSEFKEWDSFEKYDGFFVEAREDAEIIYGRMHNMEYVLRVPRADGAKHEFTNALGTFPVDPLKVEPGAPLEPTGESGPIDMKVYLTLRILLEGVLHDERINYVNA